MDTFEDFLAATPDAHKSFVATIHELLTADGYKFKVEDKATGMFIAYAHPKTKRAFCNLFFRKSGLQARIYAEGHKGYLDFLANLPEHIEAKIAKAKTCDACAPTCTKGYGFSIRGNDYFKCRYGCFHFEVTDTTKPIVMELIKLEKGAR